MTCRQSNTSRQKSRSRFQRLKEARKMKVRQLEESNKGHAEAALEEAKQMLFEEYNIILTNVPTSGPSVEVSISDLNFEEVD
ncbi:unnamed protein product [Rhizophagus irregularis]|nr:unnamed protein product [Rhizophagus irregularis]